MRRDITYKNVNEDLLSVIIKTRPSYYAVLFLVSLLAVGMYLLPWIYQIYTGQGVTGLNIPDIWGVYLVNFVFWVGVAHAGTLISAMLHITETPWRRAIARSAETMTLFALILAAFFVFIHMGRPWNFYWTFPYPTQRTIWDNFQSPLMFDVFAIGTYFTTSAIFLYFGLIPDIASLRHSVSGWRRRLYTILSLGWRGTDTQWYVHGKATLFFSAFIMPLVVSVHSIVSWDFALSMVPGYHKTIFAPYFVTGALFSGFAGVILLMSVLRWFFPVTKRYMTELHYDRVGQFLLVLSFVWSYLTLMEVVTGFYTNTSYEWEHLKYKLLTYPYSYLFALMIFSNTILPLLFIVRKVRRSAGGMFVISIFVFIGMWLERYLIIPNALSRKFLPFMWRDYHPSWVEISITLGAFAFFISMYMIFLKLFPVISMFELKENIAESDFEKS